MRSTRLNLTAIARNNSRWLALTVLCSGFLLIVVDMTIVNVALPSIQRDLGFTASGLAWVLNAYLIAFAGLLLLAGRLGDLLGRKRVFIAGLAIFTGASVLCGVAVSQEMLIATRFVQGVGGAISSAVILAMIVGLFPRPDDQAKAFGVFGVIASAGAAIGLVAGGLITQAVSWHWIFFVNLPLGIITIALAWRLLDNDRGLGLADGADVIGALLVTSALMTGVYAIVAAPPLGSISIALLVAFVVRQARARNPILPLRLFASRKITAANAVQALMSAGFLGFFFAGSLDLERVMGYAPLEIGLAFLPVAAVMGLFSVRFSALLIMRFGALAMLVVGQALIAGALLWLGLGPDIAVYPVHMLVPMALLGLGGGVAFPAVTMIAMTAVPPRDAGVGSGLLNTTGQVGGALGLAILATIAGQRTMQLAQGGSDAISAMAGGFHLAWFVSSGVVAVTLAVTVVLLRDGKQAAVAVAMPADSECAA